MWLGVFSRIMVASPILMALSEDVSVLCMRFGSDLHDVGYVGFCFMPCGCVCPATTLELCSRANRVYVQTMTKSGRFDFIKLDVEGEEKRLLKDPSSHEVLCEALCIFMELHERFEPGCVEAFRVFLQVRPPLSTCLTSKLVHPCVTQHMLTLHACARLITSIAQALSFAPLAKRD
jgi:hypothetical protein